MENPEIQKDPTPEPSLDTIYEKFPWINEGLANLRAHDEETYQHSLRVAHLTWELTADKGLNDKQRKTLYAAGLAHDLGKTGTPDKVLNFPGKLEGEAWEEMKNHVRTSIDMIRNWEDREVDVDDVPIDQVVGSHHWFGLSKYGNPPSDDPKVRRLQLFLAASDYADAVISKRTYKERKTFAEAVVGIEKVYPDPTERRVVTDTLRIREGMKDEE